jgi:hypothetical protein
VDVAADDGGRVVAGHGVCLLCGGGLSGRSGRR